MRQVYLYTLLFIFISCGEKGSVTTIDPDTQIYTISKSYQDNFQFCKAQAISLDTFNTFTTCVEESFDNIQYVSLGYAATLIKSHKEKGSWVKKGELIATFKSTDFLQLQTDYLTAKNNYKFYKKAYLRQGELAIEQATSLKKMEQTEHHYLNAEIKLKHLEAMLNEFGIRPDSVKSGNLTTKLNLYSPVSGIITSDSVLIGKHYSATDHLYKISADILKTATIKISEPYQANTISGDPVSLIGQNNIYGKVLKSTKITNGNTKYSEILVLLPNNQQYINEGHCTIQLPVRKTIYRLPKASVIEDKYVLVKKEETLFTLRNIKIIKQSNSSVLIDYDPLLMSKEFVCSGHQKVCKEIRY